MAGNDFNQRFTIEKYCTKNDVARALGTNLIEPIWREIADFRKRLSIDLPFFDTSRIKFTLTYIDPVQAKSAQTNDEVTSFVGAYSKIANGSIAQYTFTRGVLKDCLAAIARLNNLDVSEITLTNIIDNNQVDWQYRYLVNYHRALQDLKNNPNTGIDEEFLARNYAMLKGEEELTSFYRTSDVESLSSKFLVNRVYDQGIPSHMIDDIMPPLFDYITNSDISLSGRLSAIFFMFNYVRPFDSFNMELACLLAKKVISTTNINTASIYVPLESFTLVKEFFNEVSNEVKKTHDFTYASLKGSEIINLSFENAISRMNELRATSLDSEVKMGSDEEKAEEEFGPKIVVPKKAEKKSETKAQIQQRFERRAPKFELVQLSEKEIKAKINDLLETDPYLNKEQADFYVRHSTYGKYYSIQQYVKCEKVVYETARTAMERLAKGGYYRREQIKNKFVYTPINKE